MCGGCCRTPSRTGRGRLSSSPRSPDGSTNATCSSRRWWTWAGHRANATLSATLPSVIVPHRRTNGDWIRLREDLTPSRWQAALRDAQENLALPEVDGHAIRGLKFSEALPSRLAEATLAARLMDATGAETVLTEPIRLSTLTDR
jgi:ATP-dependent Lhr-like helicase